MKDAVQYGLGFVSARPVVGEQSTRCGRRRKAMCTVMRDRTAFTSSRRFSGKVQGTALELREFMRTDPGGLVKACWSEKFVQKLDENLYRTSMPPMQFLQFNLKAFADVRATYDEDIQGIRLKSVGSRVDVPQMGIDAESFQLELSGVLLGRDNSQNAVSSHRGRQHLLTREFILTPSPVAAADDRWQSRSGGFAGASVHCSADPQGHD